MIKDFLYSDRFKIPQQISHLLKLEIHDQSYGRHWEEKVVVTSVFIDTAFFIFLNIISLQTYSDYFKALFWFKARVK